MSITPKDWSKFQHYKDRSPAWVKLHRAILDDADFQRLPVASRALAPMLWLLASEYTDGKITADPVDIAWRLRMSEDDLQIALKPLLQKFFVTDASTALAPCKPDAMPEKRREEREKETDSRAIKVDRPACARSRFEEFWEAYPKRDGPNPRKPAETKFNALVKSGVDPETMIAAASALSSAEAAKGNIGTRFIPMASTWLNQQRWADHAAVSFAAEQIAEKRAAALIHVKNDTPQWEAWCKHLGRPPPSDREFGWRFPSEWPPGHSAV